MQSWRLQLESWLQMEAANWCSVAPQEQLLKLGSKIPRLEGILEKEGEISPAELGQRVSKHSPQTYLHMSPFLSLMSTGVPCMWGRAEYYCQDLPRRSEGRIFVLKCWKCNDLFDSEGKKDRNSMKIFKRKHTHTIQAAFEVNAFEIKSSYSTSLVRHILLTF